MSKHVLIIDDDNFIRDVTQVTLHKVVGWSAITAASGPEGLEMARKEALDVILLDISMPGMDGYAVFKELQADPSTRSVPVILLTAKTIPTTWTDDNKEGFAGIIEKPFNPLTVGDQISELMGW